MTSAAAPNRPEVRIGKLRLRGPWIWVIRLILIGVIVWIAYRFPPRANWPMWIAAMGWVGFAIYWSIASRNSGDARTTESSESRRVQVILINIGQALLFLPIPGLRQTFLPAFGGAWPASDPGCTGPGRWISRYT